MGRYIDLNKINPWRCPHNIAQVREWLFSLPVEDVKPVRHALWEDIPMRYEDDDPYQLFKCSHCNCETHILTNYCPYCGAKMGVK